MSDSVLESLEIQLADGPSPVYRGGELIKGKIHVRLRKQITVFAVRLQIKGRAAFLNDSKKKADIEKVYFDQDMALLERPPGKRDPHHFAWIANFDYHLPFEMPLPKGCPTSFEGPHGFIRYFIKASLVEEDGSDLREYFVKSAFSIVAPSDGHIVRGEPTQTTETVSYGKCCCKGKVTADLQLPRTGYLPGESVYGKIKINNKKPKEFLSQMEVRLVDRVLRVGTAEPVASPYRTLLYRKLEHQELPKGVKNFEGELFLLMIPPVPPTTKGDFDNITEEMNQSPTKGLFESPSTATLRFRKVPFLRVDYAIQLTLGHSILLEIPIQIGELKTKDEATILRPFVAGAQPIEEADESGKIAFNGPFLYTPMYPYAESLGNGGSVGPPTVRIEEPSDELKHSKLKELEGQPGATTTIIQETSHPDKNTTVQTTTVHTELPDGSNRTETQTTTTTTMTSEPVVLERIHEIPPSPVQEDEVKRASIVRQPSPITIPAIIETPPDLPPRESPEPPVDVERTVSTTENEEGVTTTTTETFTEDGITTTRTTTVTRHPDGSETTHVREESSQEKEIISHQREIPSPIDYAATEPQEGDETYTQTETIEENGVTTIRTTTVTKHADGSESKRVHEESHSPITEEE
ncbi:unnamed protein product, partial [Mesorhabditis belari]|uniref:Arrestin C-terminal-like domain-containing protein n=1 Tax=Mesorhabditis belari TaxID=2138241 RepID=A0AAF3FBX3_9BILA